MASEHTGRSYNYICAMKGVGMDDTRDAEAGQLGRYVPFETLVTEHDVLTRGGDLIRTWRLDVPRGDRPALERHPAFASLLQQLAGGRFALWLHRIRREETGVMRDDVYLTVLVRSVPRRSPRFLRIPKKSLRSPSGCHGELLSVMQTTTTVVDATLAELRPQLLGEYCNAARRHNAMLEFLGYLVNGQWVQQKPTLAQLHKSLPRVQGCFTGEKIVLQHGCQERHAVAFGMADCTRPVWTREHSLRLPPDWEFIETQSFSPPFERSHDWDVAAYLQQRSDGAATTQSGTLGDYHYSLVLFGKDARNTEHRAAAAAYVMGATLGMAVAPCDMSDAAWFSQWPGTWSWRARQARLSTRAPDSATSYQAVPDGQWQPVDATLRGLGQDGHQGD